MNTVFSPRSVKWLIPAVLGVACVFLGPSVSLAAYSAPTLQADLIYELVADRARMIQISLVVVAFGCAIMWWYR
ncbi:MAG: hypothetical protein EXR98_13765 [Gemmataceae bacterium]|nr:hypothetical protein [Gemmataceae bacterium]